MKRFIGESFRDLAGQHLGTSGACDGVCFARSRCRLLFGDEVTVIEP